MASPQTDKIEHSLVREIVFQGVEDLHPRHGAVPRNRWCRGLIYSENDRLSDKEKSVKMPDIPIIHLVG
jgi:hypothetical protein